MAGLWLSREHALAVLSEQTPDVLAALDDAFCLMDDCASALWAVNTPFARVTALYAAKSRNLALGCYSLTLDSLAQEGGALLRPLLECHELLTYFRLDPSRVHEALENRLPSAGSVAKRIGSNYQVARDYLNQHASHVSMHSSTCTFCSPCSGLPASRRRTVPRSLSAQRRRTCRTGSLR
jgi:hypothetical protein